MSWQTLLNFYASAEVDASDAARLKAILGTASDTNPEKLNLLDDLKTVGASISRLQSEKIALTWADGTPIIADGDKVYAFSSTSKQYADSALFSPSASGYSGDGAAAIPTDWVKQFGPGTALQYQNEIGSLSGVNIGAQEQYQRLSTLLGGGIVPLIDGDLVLEMLGGVGAKGMLALIGEKRAASLAADEAKAIIDELAPPVTAVDFLPKATRNSAGQIETNATQRSAITTLESHGYQKTISQDGSVTVLTNGEKTYRFYPSSTSTGQPSASLTINGSKKPAAKIRFSEE
ncbi:hypothetical protein [Pseudomonas graminis]|uniref:Filamentous hemagglutinin n=1 Tax=Pseudomonas graminis TaxID=158627 RepID=A0A1I0JV03_9PSED|nr:hypothetical protein [Pseudomonas graminis]SEU13712.1 filamentous hemagglutinin [Pseudomonas graminis]